MFCPHCGKEIAEGQVFCQHCGGRIPAPEPADALRAKVAWEDRESLGFFTGLFRTIKESLFTPADFFRKMGVTGGLSDPLLYALITGMAGIMVSYFWQILLQDSFQGMLPANMKGAGFDFFRNVGMAAVAILLPFVIIIWLFIWSGFLHLLLMLVGGAKNGFETTFRVVSYAYGANLFMVVPVCGGFLAILWSVVISIIGLKEAHGTSGGKASFAVLFPLILCCGMAFLAVAMILGVAAASLGNFPGHQWR